MLACVLYQNAKKVSSDPLFQPLLLFAECCHVVGLVGGFLCLDCLVECRLMAIGSRQVAL